MRNYTANSLLVIAIWATDPPKPASLSVTATTDKVGSGHLNLQVLNWQVWQTRNRDLSLSQILIHLD